MALPLALNPDLDLDAHAETYAREGLVRVDNLLTAPAAEAVVAMLEQQLPWRLTLSAEDNVDGLYDQARIEAAGPAGMQAELGRLMQRAREGFGYVYLSYPMINAYLAKWDEGHPIHAVSEFINSPAFVEMFRRLTGRADVIKADAKATLYRPGDFLTLHDDGVSQGRVAAYTLGFTRGWRPDWGGQLLLHGDDLEITRGLSPTFNSLTLFKVPQWHSVAPAAPYAGAPRLSIVGWARTDPKL